MPNQYTDGWTTNKLNTARKIVSKHSDIDSAIKEISNALGKRCTFIQIDNAFKRYGLPTPKSLLKKEAQSPLEPGDSVKRLYQLTKKKPLPFSLLCDKFDMSPSKMKAVIEEARSFGVLIKVEHDHVGVSQPTANDQIQDVKIAPTVGELQTIGVITDTHLGSKYCLRPQLKDFIEYAYDKGVREILHVGDVLDGDYDHGKFEMSHMGLDAQSEDLFEVLPKKKGLSYHGITGNHDWTFTAKSGVNVGRHLENFFANRGRDDLKFYGDRGAYLKIRGAVIHLWHPSGGVAYALSYAMQKKVESYSSGAKPQILLIGHWHKYCHIFERGVQALACGTFQGGGSAFSKSLKGSAPAIGGTILSWRATKEGTLREFNVERRNYFEVETRFDVDSEDGILVEDLNKKKK